MNFKYSFLICFFGTISTLNLGTALKTLDAANTQVIDAFISKHLKDSTMSKIRQSLASQDNLERQCVAKVNDTIRECVSCSKSACGTTATVPVHISPGSSVQDTVKGILTGLAKTPVNVAVKLTDSLVHGVSHVVHEISHGVEHVAHEISHGIHHIGHHISHIFGKRMESCALTCSACQKVNSNDMNLVKRTVCGNDYVSKTNALQALVPKFREISKAIQSKGIIQKVEYDPASLVQHGGSVSYGTVYLTAKVRGSLHRFKTSSPFQLMNVDASATVWTHNVFNLFLS